MKGCRPHACPQSRRRPRDPGQPNRGRGACAPPGSVAHRVTRHPPESLTEPHARHDRGLWRDVPRQRWRPPPPAGRGLPGVAIGHSSAHSGSLFGALTPFFHNAIVQRPLATALGRVGVFIVLGNRQPCPGTERRNMPPGFIGQSCVHRHGGARAGDATQRCRGAIPRGQTSPAANGRQEAPELSHCCR